MTGSGVWWNHSGQGWFIVQTSPDLVTRLVTGDGWPPSLTFHPSLLNRPNYCICLSFEPQMIHSGHGGVRGGGREATLFSPCLDCSTNCILQRKFGRRLLWSCVSGEETLSALVEGMSPTREYHPRGAWASGSQLLSLPSWSLGLNSSSTWVSDFLLCSLANCTLSTQWSGCFPGPTRPSSFCMCRDYISQPPAFRWLCDRVLANGM